MRSTRWWLALVVAPSLIRPAAAAAPDLPTVAPEMRQAIGDGAVLRALADHGSAAHAMVLELWDLGETFPLWDSSHQRYASMQPLGMRLEVLPSDPAVVAFAITVTTRVGRLDLPRVQAGSLIPVVFNPARHDELATAADLSHALPYLITPGGNPYHDTYRPGRLSATAAAAAATEAPALYQGGFDPFADRRRLEQLGYVELGRAQFEGVLNGTAHLTAVAADRDKARDQGRRIGAELAVLYGTTVGSSPLAPLNQLPGFEVASPSSTLGGPQRLAVYWTKAPADPLGVRFLLADEAPARGFHDEGLLVEAVVKGSPAAAAGIREGDALLGFEGRPIGDGETLPTLLAQAAGRPSRIDLRRGLQRLSLTVTPGVPVH